MFYAGHQVGAILLQAEYFVGIDAGSYQCRVKLTDSDGNELASNCVKTTPMASDFSAAITTALTAVEQAFARAGLPPDAQRQASAAFGLASGHIGHLCQQAQAWPMPFMQHRVVSDLEIACLGAHAGQCGGVLIVGTGSQGTAFDGQQFHSVGGWGFALADQGSGAQLGRSALRLALSCHQRLNTHTPLTQALMAQFEQDVERMQQWASTATPSQWASFSPLIFDYAARQDNLALHLIDQLAADIDDLLAFLTNSSQQGKVSLLGGIANPITPYLAPNSRRRLRKPLGDVLQGALLLARSD